MMRRNTVYVFLGVSSNQGRFMTTLKQRGLLEDGAYIVVGVEFETNNVEQSYKYYFDARDVAKGVALSTRIEAARSLLVIVGTPPASEEYPEFEEKVREYNRKEPFNLKDPPFFIKKLNYKKHITIMASYLFDSVMLYAEALDEVLRENGSPTNGAAIINKILQKRYQSVSGAWMTINKNGDGEGNFTVLALQEAPDYTIDLNESITPGYTMLPVGMFHYDDKNSDSVYFSLKKDAQILWVNGEAPIDEPICGYDGNGCQEKPNKNKEIVAGVLGSILFMVTLSAIIVYKNWKYEQEIAGLSWKIDIKEIKPVQRGGFSSSVSRVSIEFLSLVSQGSLESRYIQLFAQTSNYKGKTVVVKVMTFQKKNVDISRETKKEMRLMRDMKQDNINPFIGACVESNNVCIVWDYCIKGSLTDILENDDLKLDNMFLASLVFDLIKGMIFIHDSDLHIHGNLKSYNCVVTSKWVLQLTDFGLHELRRSADKPSDDYDCEEYEYHHIKKPLYRSDPYYGMLWKAPELLHDNSGPGTQKSDVFAFGIILHEIIGREGAYGNHQLDPTELINKVKYPINGVTFRPSTSNLECQDYVLSCMTDCWAENPDNRPDFRQIRSRLMRMKQGMKSNIFDNMMDMMEKYANNLEDLVSERQALLIEEKKKTEILLHRMLPQSVAKKLIAGLPVIPESFNAVTIYFSDIVGFTSLSASSSPLQVVNFLNSLYTLFDDIISAYDVYKVETIGDAYMVVSGLPIRNGDRHAGEIASMALELLEKVKSFKIKHMSDQTLKLRIGIHTGPVVAGVVGLTMPRYCLFGDTVNTASRMESNGEALKIHISGQCRDYLLQLSGYEIEKRGIIPIKGKGEVITYWLTGQTKYAPGIKQENHKDDVNCVNKQPLFPSPLCNGDIKKISPKVPPELMRRPSSFILNNSRTSNSRNSVTLRTDEPIQNGVVTGNKILPTMFRSPNENPRTSAKVGWSPQLNRNISRLRKTRGDSDPVVGLMRRNSGCELLTQRHLPISPEKTTKTIGNKCDCQSNNNGILPLNINSLEYTPESAPMPSQHHNDIVENVMHEVCERCESFTPLLPHSEKCKKLNKHSALMANSKLKPWRSCDELMQKHARNSIKGWITGLFGTKYPDGHRQGNSNISVEVCNKRDESMV
ncbi:Receptor-type guanylate cyclase Gyc76C [Nymphon striatum]|nr:Receptor-type guanylate cyclase Gyc76C [Nymphon striatum]